MTRRKMKGNQYNHRIAADKIGTKRSRATFKLKVQAEPSQLPMRFSETECDVCGKEGAFLRRDGKFRCTKCEQTWNG